jgi:molybdopterin molybdotransferase
MVTMEQALGLVKKSIPKKTKVKMALSLSFGKFLAEKIYAPISMPPFNQSAMDGYVISNSKTDGIYCTTEVLKAGDDATGFMISENEAIRIFTGAMVPQNAYAVVRQEDVERDGSKIIIKSKIRAAENIRFEGEQIHKGELLFDKYTYISAPVLGMLAMMGIEQVEVFEKPKIAIIVTGNELEQVGRDLTPGKIYESNSIVLVNLLKQEGFDAKILFVKDNLVELTAVFEKEVRFHDVILFSGGISVGDYDFVGQMLINVGVEQIFYKVLQKPGKPVFFGFYRKKAIYGLPGNPAAALTCLKVYVLPLLQKMAGNSLAFSKYEQKVFKGTYQKPEHMTHFLKGRVTEDGVVLGKEQNSSMLKAFREADCLIVMKSGTSEWRGGEKVQIIRL